MKKLLLMAVAAFTLAISANAQSEQNKDQSKKEFRQQNQKKQFTQLNLTQEQKDQMQKIRQESKQKRESIKNDKSLTDQQRSEKMKELGANNRKQMNNVLTQEQKDQLKASRQNMRKGGKKMMHNRKGKVADKSGTTETSLQ